jgi:hypothetical protein
MLSGGQRRFHPGVAPRIDARLGLTLLPELTVRRLAPEARRRQVRPFAPPVPTR